MDHVAPNSRGHDARFIEHMSRNMTPPRIVMEPLHGTSCLWYYSNMRTAKLSVVAACTHQGLHMGTSGAMLRYVIAVEVMKQ